MNDGKKNLKLQWQKLEEKRSGLQRKEKISMKVCQL